MSKLFIIHVFDILLYFKYCFWRNLDQEITKENVDCPNKIGYDISMQRFWIRCHQIKVFSVICTKDGGNFVVLKLYIQNVHISFLVSKKILSNPYFHCSISKLIQFCIQKNTLYSRRGQDPLTHITSGLIYNYLHVWWLWLSWFFLQICLTILEIANRTNYK